MRDLGLDDDSATNLRSVSQLTPCSDHHQVVSHFTDFIASQQFDSNPQLVNHADINLQDVYSNQNSGYGLNSLDHLCNNFNGFSNLNVGFDFIEELIRAADCFDSNELQLAQAILARLNQRLRSPVGKPIQRAAFFFKEALVSLLSGTNRAARLSSWYEIVQTIRAYKAFSGLSPIPMFAQFTVNQALLDSLDWPSSPFLHIVDFDIGFGGQYASLMREMAERTDSSRLGPPFVRVTAVVPEEYAIETRLVKDNLTQFAQELRIRFQIEFVLARSFEMLSFKTIKFMEGERTAVLLSPAIFRRLSSENGAAGFVSDLRRVSPSVVVFVDSEGWTESSGATSFRREFVSSLEFYSMMLESLDTAAVAAGDWVRRIEMFLVRPKILAAVEGAAGPRVGSSSWKELFFGAGMRPVSLSQFADFQAECLLGKMQVRGFHVAKRQAELVLCWQDRALVATSAWRC